MNLIVQGADIGKLGVNLLQILPAVSIRGDRCVLKGIQGCVCAENGVSYIGIQDTQKHMFGVFQVLDLAVQLPAVHKKISFSYQGRAKNPKCSDDCNRKRMVVIVHSAVENWNAVIMKPVSIIGI